MPKTTQNSFAMSSSDYPQLVIRQDEASASIWYSMSPTGRPCFSQALLSDLKRFQEDFTRRYRFADVSPDYLVLASEVPGIFNLGGDLDLFVPLIEKRDRKALHEYAKACVDVMFAHMSSLDCDLITISLVEGKALGGGFEAALASNILIAEEGSRFGFPEIMFNMFPGMGAYSVLSRRVGEAMAEKMILSGKIYTARELYDMGLVTILTDDGKGEKAVVDYMDSIRNRKNGTRALMKARQASNPVTLTEMNRIIDIWVDAALSITKRDLKLMAHLVARQRRNMKRDRLAQ